MIVKFLIYINIKLKKLLMIIQNWWCIKRHKIKLDVKGYGSLKRKLITAQHIGDWIDENIKYIPDGVIDFPQKAILTFTRKFGDCEDFGILASDLLHGVGIETKIVDMYFLEGKSIAGHSIAIFAVSSEPGVREWGVIGTEGYISPKFQSIDDVVKSYGWDVIAYAIRNYKYNSEKIVWMKDSLAREKVVLIYSLIPFLLHPHLWGKVK